MGHLFDCKVCGGRHRSTSWIGQYHYRLGIVLELRREEKTKGEITKEKLKR